MELSIDFMWNRRNLARAAVIFTAFSVSYLGLAAPPLVDKASDTKLKPAVKDQPNLTPDEDTTSQLEPGYEPSFMQLFATDSHPATAQSPGLRCSGFAVRGSDSKIYVATAAHCLALAGFSLGSAEKDDRRPRTIVLADELTSIRLASDEYTVQFAASLRSRFKSKGGPIDAVSADRSNIGDIFFPGGEKGCSTWPSDFARIVIAEASLPKDWRTSIRKLSLYKKSSPKLESPVVVVAGGCVLADDAACKRWDAPYRRYEDAGFRRTADLCSGKTTIKSGSTASVMPGDSGGTVLGPSPGQLVGVISARLTDGRIVLAEFSEDYQK